MNNTNLNDFVTLAQILVPVVVLIGIIISMWLSVKALREVQTDRKLRQMPHLAFELGGGEYKIEFIKSGKAISGIDYSYARGLFPHISDDAESISLKTAQATAGGRRRIIQEYGKLKNYGLGPALSAAVSWIPEKVQIGSEIFSLSEEKLLEPQYCEEHNRIPSSPSHILPGEVARFFRYLHLFRQILKRRSGK